MSLDLSRVRAAIDEARQHAEELPVNDNPTAANAYAAIQALAAAVEALAEKVEPLRFSINF